MYNDYILERGKGGLHCLLYIFVLSGFKYIIPKLGIPLYLRLKFSFTKGIETPTHNQQNLGGHKCGFNKSFCENLQTLRCKIKNFTCKAFICYMSLLPLSNSASLAQMFLYENAFFHICEKLMYRVGMYKKN